MRPWDEILAAPAAAEGTWAALPPNGWGALVAYLAGPGRVRAVPRGEVWVRITETTGGVDHTRTEPATDEGLAMEDWFTTSYLVDHGVPPAPEGVTFEVLLPPGAAMGDLESRVTGVDGAWVIPDWSRVAEEYDGVHVTVACHPMVEPCPSTRIARRCWRGGARTRRAG